MQNSFQKFEFIYNIININKLDAGGWGHMVLMIKNRAFLWTAVLFFVNDEKSTSL